MKGSTERLIYIEQLCCLDIQFTKTTTVGETSCTQSLSKDLIKIKFLCAVYCLGFESVLLCSTVLTCHYEWMDSASTDLHLTQRPMTGLHDPRLQKLINTFYLFAYLVYVWLGPSSHIYYAVNSSAISKSWVLQMQVPFRFTVCDKWDTVSAA